MEWMVPLFSSHHNLWVRKDFSYHLNQPIYRGFTWSSCLSLEPTAQRTNNIPTEDYDDEDVPVPEAPPTSQLSEGKVPSAEENGMRASQTGEWNELISYQLVSLTWKGWIWAPQWSSFL